MNRTGKAGAKILALIILISSAAYAAPSRPPDMPNGACWADPMNDMIISLGVSSFTSNLEGATAEIIFNTTPSKYSGWCYSESGMMQAGFYSSSIGVNTPGKTPGFYQLSEDVDYKISILFGVYTASPFNNLNIGGNAGPTGNGVTKLQQATIGNSGTVTFRLRRKLIGGAFNVPGGVQLADLYRHSISGNVPTIPIYRLYSQQAFIPVPSECSINNGQTINVPFGSIDTSLLTTSAASSPYKQEQNIQYQCNTALNQDIKVNLAASPALFGDAIKTSNPDIGVVMQYQNKNIKPNGSFNTRLSNGQGSDKITFSVIGSGTKPTTGPFTGSATLIISTL